MQLLNVDELIPHKKNNYFFDDIEGEPWMAFLESIETSGVIEPVIATQDKVIVSGHQRVRACKKLGIKQVWTDIRTFDSDDEVLKQLIETNIRQRGIGNINSVKMMRCERELERIYGVQHGGDHRSNGTGFPLKTQEQLASESNMSTRQWRNIKNIEKLVPEIQDMLEDGRITEKAVRGLYNKLSQEEQREMAVFFKNAEKVSSSEVQDYINKIKEKDSENERLRKLVSEKDAQRIVLEQRLAERPAVAKVEVKEVEVVPADYEIVKADLARTKKERQKYLDAMNEANDRLKEYEDPKSDKKERIHLEEDAESFIMNTYTYIKRNGGFVWITEKMDKLSDQKSKEFKQAIMAIDAFAKQMVENIGGYDIG